MSAFGFLKKAALAIGAVGLVFVTGGLAGPLIFGLSSLQVAVGGFIAASLIGGFIKPKIGDVETLIDRLTITQNPNEPRWIAFGEFGMSGNVVYQEQIDSELWVAIALAGHEINSFVSFRWGDTTVTFSGNNAVGDLNGFLFKYDFLGTDAQTVWSALDSASSNWTSDHRGRGQSYIGIKWVQDADNAPDWQNPVQVLKGLKLYDPRLDTTRGGSGSHRTDDHLTWVWSDNPALCIVAYMLGIRVANSATDSYDGQIIAGMGVDPERIDWANIRAEANFCDESVTLDAGGSESRYTCNGLIDPRNDHRTNLEILASSMGGTIVFQGGKWRIYAAVPRAVVKTRGTDDIIGDIRVRRYKSRDEKANAVRGIYADVDTNYKPRDIIPLVNSTYVTEDGGDELWMDVNLPMTTSGTMAQRLAKIALERNRREIVVTANFTPVALQDQAMDSITFNHPALGLSSQKMRIADWQMGVAADDEGNPLVVFPMVLEEEDDAIYGWDETADEQAIPASVTVTSVERVKRPIANADIDDNTIEAAKLKTDLAVNLNTVVPGALSFAIDETDTQIITITNVEAPTEKFFDWTALFVKAGHRIIVVVGEVTTGRADLPATLAPTGGYKLYRRIDGGSPTEIAALAPVTITSLGGLKIITTDLVDAPADGDIEYRIGFTKTASGGHDDLKAWDAHINTEVLFSK